MVTFLFFVHTLTEAKQSNRQGGARAMDLPAESFDLARPSVAPPLNLLQVGLRVASCSNLLNNKGLDASCKLLKHSIRIKPTSITCIHC